MQSKVHPTYKTKYCVANWAAYNQALVRRGDVTVWLSSEAVAAWTPGRSGRRGGQRRYSDLAIETAMTGSSPADAIRHWSAEGGHPIQDLTAEDGLTPLSGWTAGEKAISDDGLVAEERVLHSALTMVP